MQEGTVTTGGTTYKLAPPFFVLATQNPIEQEGTFPLPEAQLDRFMFKVVVPFLSREELNEVVSRTILKQKMDVTPIIDGPRILHLRTVLDRVVVSEAMRDYACRMVLATHPDSPFATERVKRYLRWGASPRAAQALIRAARVRALSLGRPHVSFEDIRWFGPEVLQHRALLNYDGQAENVSVTDVIDECIRTLPVEA
jgi:MoxR-like ATPase